MRKLLLACAAACAFACAAPCADTLPQELDQLVLHGIDAIHQIDFDTAEKDFQSVLQKYPGQPYGYFGLALAQWGRLEYQHEESSPELAASYEEKTDEAIDKGNAWLKDHPNDPHAHLCVGGMYGLRSRLALMKHSWLRAYFSGMKGVSHMKTAIKLDPELYDAYMGPGMYEYYAGTLSGVVKVFARLFMHGDPNKGIQYITLVKDKGRYIGTAAKLLLIEIYTQTGSKYANPKQALEWANELREKYPGHPMLHFVQIVCQYESGHYDMVRSGAEEYLKFLDEKKPGYRETYRPRALVALGTSYLAEKQLEPALEAFLKAEPVSMEHPNRWAVWAVVREGNIHDLQGDREKALAAYRRALTYEDHWGFEDYIKVYIKNPYTYAQNPGQLPPP